MKFISASGLTVMVLAAINSGCATHRQSTATPDTEAFASRVIAEKVSVAASAHQRYVALVAEDQSRLASKQATLESDFIDVDYIGKPQDLVQAIASRYGYRYYEEGRTSLLRVINIRVTKAMPIEVLQNVGRQIDAGADVELDKTSKTIKLIYKTK